jgi:hypothetical protein
MIVPILLGACALALAMIYRLLKRQLEPRRPFDWRLLVFLNLILARFWIAMRIDQARSPEPQSQRISEQSGTLRLHQRTYISTPSSAM